MDHPVRLIAIAFGLLLIGAVLPFLMVISVIQSTVPLNILAVVCSVGGITLGFIAITLYRGRRK
jgi:hypothetical protein